MPIYEYHCSACGAEFELLVRIGAQPICPQCGSTTPEKRISAPSAPGRSAALLRAGRQAAAREGHFSNYSSAERRALKK